MLIQSQDKQFLLNLLNNLKTQGLIKHWKKHQKLTKTRYFCLDQLITTETDYNRDLKLIHQKIQIPLRQNNIITQQQQRQMFPNIQGMINLSTQLLNDIHKLKNQWNPYNTLVGPTMIRYSKFLQIYSEFFKSYTNTLSKLKQMLERKQVKLIQNELQPNSFQNLWSKPFQRPLKYKLILTSYIKHTYIAHPDYQHLQIAIERYQQVSQRNNKALQHKQKSQILLSLQARFTGIINNQAKYYIDQIEATMMDVRVKCHVLSNMILISNIEDSNQTELMRILFDENSFVSELKDGLYFKNRLFICGKRMSTHLTFKDKASRAMCQKWIEGIINQLYKAQFTRSQLSSKNRRSSYSRDSLQEARRSYTNLSQILPKPPRFLVLNQIKRRYACLKTFKIYFILKFMLPYGQDSSQYLYVELDQILSLEATMRYLYSYELRNIPNIQQTSKSMNSTQMKINSVKSLQYKAIYATIFINFLFRHPQVVKRTDIIAHKLHINETMWIYLRYGLLKCSCLFCRDGDVINSVQDYTKELSQRIKNRSKPNTFFCPFRTIHSQNMFGQNDLSLISTAIDRLFFIKCYKGLLDYRLIDSTPNSIRRRKVVIKMERLQSQRNLQILIDPHQRVGQIIEVCSKMHRIRMEDYQMFLTVNKNVYMLGRDQILWKILQNQSIVGQNIFSFFKSAFGQKQDLTFHLYLKKVWVLQAGYEKSNYNIDEVRISFIIEQFMVRLRRQEIKLNIQDTSNFYACYYVFQKLDKTVNISQEELKALIPHKKWKAMEIQQRTQMLEIVQLKIEKLRGKFTQPQILKNIWNYTIKMGQSCLGWSAFYFNALIVSHPQYPEGFQVKIGVDLNNFYIKQAQKVTTVLQYSLQQAQNMIIFSSWQLHLSSPQFQYIFTGDCLFHIQQIMNTYLLYKKLQKD